MLERTNLLGVVVSVAIYILYILMMVFRLLGKPQYGHWLASAQFLSVITFVYLLLKTPPLERPLIYYVQVSLMMIFLLIEFLLDYILKIEFRQERWMVITYVTLFFAATGGLLGVVAYAEDRVWMVTAIILFLVMGVLAFVQRAVTGM